MEILNKSKENFDAAGCMLSIDLYAPAVHSMYYGIFLLIKHLLKIKKNIQYDPQTAGAGSHNSIFNELVNDYTNNTTERITLLRHYQKLKRDRENADYSDIEIDNSYAQGSLKDMGILINNITNHFNFTL